MINKVVVVGYPIIAKLINGCDVELESLGVTLIPDSHLCSVHNKIISERRRKNKEGEENEQN